MINTIVVIKKSSMYLSTYDVSNRSIKNLALILFVLFVFSYIVCISDKAFPTPESSSNLSNSSFVYNITDKDFDYFQYVDSVEGFSMNYPKNWLIGSSNQPRTMTLDLGYPKLISFYSPNNTESFSIYSHEIQYNFFNDLINIFANLKQNPKSTLDGFAITFFQKILDKKLENFNYIKSESGEVILKNNLPARVLVLEFENVDKTYKVLSVLTIKSNNVYILEYLSEKDIYSKNFYIARSFIDSLKFFK
ncbi:MAG: hypothetical protein H0X03_06235 [Nitrosopumilus sp.]|nr:hypothetical protein [Nitrosopumilus sp.]